jgi:hypothetical protein
MPSVSMLYEIPGSGKRTVLDAVGVSGPVADPAQLTWQVELETANDASAGAQVTFWLGGAVYLRMHMTKTDANLLGAALTGTGSSGTVTAATGP